MIDCEICSAEKLHKVDMVSKINHKENLEVISLLRLFSF